MSYRDNWITPDWLFDWVNDGCNFELDAAASAENAKCTRYYTKGMNGLEWPWAKQTWCNPPYSEKAKWVEKAIAERKNGNSSMLLLPVDTSTKWFARCVAEAWLIVFLTEGRVKFVHPETGKETGGNPSGSMLVHFNAEHPDSQIAGIYFTSIKEIKK